MLQVSRPTTTKKVALLSLVALLLWNLRSLYLTASYWETSHVDISELSEISDLFDFEPADSEAIRKVCRDTDWNRDLVFTCERSGGGIANLRNSILNCVRYTIQAGAGLVIPRIVLRSPVDIAGTWNRETAELDHVFDRTHFLQSLEKSCPQLQIFTNIEEIPDYDPAYRAGKLLPEGLVEIVPPEGLVHPEEWRVLFYNWLEGSPDFGHKPNVVDLEPSYFQYPVHTDGEPFVLDFGRMLKFNSGARVLATTTIKNLLQAYDFNVDLSEVIFKKAYFGAHLRTERDSQHGWPPARYEYSKYTTQSNLYLDQAISSGISIIYAASGDASQIARFSEDAKAQNLTVTTKEDLLLGEDRERLEGMTSDQAALVDWLVLQKSSSFGGIGHSSFALNIGLWRHQFAERRDHWHGPQFMSDELSQIYGAVNQYPEYSFCLWP
ncbi:hypothetical protein LSUE1_G005528 [Lachnellula suecica]|uniref:Alternative oxidase n=1 Tax=Lachnellula suecica TaxID=602035 RepID=A0A8T9C8S1_9HELO|nr:hypothetical protein LSUE1_G005528 [Lachnellula suecica]